MSPRKLACVTYDRAKHTYGKSADLPTAEVLSARIDCLILLKTHATAKCGTIYRPREVVLSLNSHMSPVPLARMASAATRMMS